MQGSGLLAFGGVGFRRRDGELQVKTKTHTA